VIVVFSPRCPPAAAVAAARALVRGGLPVIEVTLRGGGALDTLAEIAHEVPEAIVGAGTVLDGQQLATAIDAGAQFAASPGSTPALLAAAAGAAIPLLPGVASASELMAGLAAGWTRFKLFPASAIGGPALLRAFGGPFPQVRFCPTGGLTLASVPEYLGLANVACIGGSWLTPDAAIAAADWPAIEALARAAAALPRPQRPAWRRRGQRPAVASWSRGELPGLDRRIDVASAPGRSLAGARRVDGGATTAREAFEGPRRWSRPAAAPCSTSARLSAARNDLLRSAHLACCT
jgi:2-dehydro-3-deoxyphosphogluconate aldolase/(4S)-4-hydroxy-2-oxoglutarate aldolase